MNLYHSTRSHALACSSKEAVRRGIAQDGGLFVSDSLGEQKLDVSTLATMDYAAIARYYSSMYQKVIKNCRHCALKKRCGQCMMHLKEKDGKLTCPQIRGGAYLQKRFSDFLSYAEQNPGDYERLLSSLIVS